MHLSAVLSGVCPCQRVTPSAWGWHCQASSREHTGVEKNAPGYGHPLGHRVPLQTAASQLGCSLGLAEEVVLCCALSGWQASHQPGSWARAPASKLDLSGLNQTVLLLPHENPSGIGLVWVYTLLLSLVVFKHHPNGWIWGVFDYSVPAIIVCAGRERSGLGQVLEDA